MIKFNQLNIKGFFLVLVLLSSISSAKAIDRLPEGQIPLTGESSKGYSNSAQSIIEEIDPKYQKEYEKWKALFRSVPYGASLWNRYSTDPDFKLRIRVGKNGGGNKGAETGQWIFNKEGRPIEATITFGIEIGTGVPNPLIYPILGHLSSNSLSAMINVPFSRESMILGIWAHEFGHVETARAVGPDFSRLVSLTKQIRERYKAVGINGLRNDPQLVHMFKELENLQTEVRTDEESEILAERTAIIVLEEYFGKDLPSPLKKAIERYKSLYPGMLNFSK
jgi:hypothetical protein